MSSSRHFDKLGPKPEFNLDLQRVFKLMVVFPLLAALTIGGFGVGRLISGDYVIATFDFAVGFSFLGLAIYTYITGKEDISRWASAIISLLGPIYFLLQLSPTGIFWVYSSTIVFYYLVPLRGAIVLNVIMLSVVAYIYVTQDYTPVEISTFVITIGLINAFSMAFAELTEKSIRDRVMLQQAKREVEQLRELLPMCASCHKIRDEEGDWHQLEAYMRDNRDTIFSHGLCPECIPEIR